MWVAILFSLLLRGNICIFSKKALTEIWRIQLKRFGINIVANLGANVSHVVASKHCPLKMVKYEIYWESFAKLIINRR